MKYLIVFLLFTFFGGCYYYPEYRVPYAALIVSVNHTSRGETNLFYPSRSDQQTNIIGRGKLIKEGRSCSSSLFYIDFFVFLKGASIKEAAESAGIVSIGSIEYSLFSVFGIFTKECIIIRGE